METAPAATITSAAVPHESGTKCLCASTPELLAREADPGGAPPHFDAKTHTHVSSGNGYGCVVSMPFWQRILLGNAYNRLAPARLPVSICCKASLYFLLVRLLPCASLPRVIKTLF